MRAAERDEAARAAWRAAAATLAPAELVFVGESSTNTAMTSRYARAPRGQRAVGSAPRHRGPNVTLLAALGPGGIGPAMVLEGAVDGDAFAADARGFLAPGLRPGQVVVRDNLSAHKDERVRAAVELAFAKIKAHRRRAAARERQALEGAIREALDAVTAADALGFFAHCGFPIEAN